MSGFAKSGQALVNEIAGWSPLGPRCMSQLVKIDRSMNVMCNDIEALMTELNAAAIDESCPENAIEYLRGLRVNYSQMISAAVLTRRAVETTIVAIERREMRKRRASHPPISGVARVLIANAKREFSGTVADAIGVLRERIQSADEAERNSAAAALALLRHELDSLQDVIRRRDNEAGELLAVLPPEEYDAAHSAILPDESAASTYAATDDDTAIDAVERAHLNREPGILPMPPARPRAADARE